MTKTIRLFEICWIDHLLYYFSLMHFCGINTDLLLLTLFVHYFTNLLQNIITTVISNDATNELTIYAKLCWNVAIFYRQYLISLCQVQENLKVCGNSSFLSSCFIVGDNHIKTIPLHAALFNKKLFYISEIMSLY